MNPIFFGELPQGTPSISPVDVGVIAQTGYATASDVCALNKARIPGVGNNPTIGDIDTYIEMIAGQIDAVILTRGYQVPVNVASHPQVEGLLGWVNATGAAYLLEESAPAPQQTVADRLKTSFDAAIKMLRDGDLAMDTDMEQARAEPRAPFITYQPTGEYFDPTLSAGQGGDGISGGPGAAGTGVVGGAGSNRAAPFFTRSIRW